MTRCCLCVLSVLSPTRELAEQTQKVLLAIGEFMSVKCHACIGGKSIGEDIRRLEVSHRGDEYGAVHTPCAVETHPLRTGVVTSVRSTWWCGCGGCAWQSGVHVVSGTPGRVADMLRRRHLRTRGIKLFVIDEADEMLNRGFVEQIYEIYRWLPPSTQVRPARAPAALFRHLCCPAVHSCRLVPVACRCHRRVCVHHVCWTVCGVCVGGAHLGDDAEGGAGHDAEVHERACACAGEA